MTFQTTFPSKNLIGLFCFYFGGRGCCSIFIFTANKLLTLLNCSNLALLGQFQCRATALRKYNDQNKFGFSTAVVGRLKPSRATAALLCYMAVA